MIGPPPRPPLFPHTPLSRSRVPPLRDRREDLPLLVDHFLDQHAAEMGRPRPAVQPIALRRLLLYSYPGNVRELQDRKSTRLNSSHGYISYAVFCLKKKKQAY